jgi:hypothetical protein
MMSATNFNKTPMLTTSASPKADHFPAQCYRAIRGVVKSALSAAFNDGCDAIVATTVLGRDRPADMESKLRTSEYQGLVESLAHPGSNITGFTSSEFSMGGKWIEILKEIAPNITRLALIYNPIAAPYVEFYIRAFQAAAPRFAVELQPTPIHNAAEIERAISAFAGSLNGGLFVAPDNTTALNRDRIISLAAKYRLPTIYPYRFFAAGNGLISYGVDIADFFRGAAIYIDRIFKGADPGTLPLQQPVKFELVIIHIDRQKAGLGHHPSPDPRPQMPDSLPAARVIYQFAPGQLQVLSL